MMTSANTSFPRLFTEIDALTRADHSFLTEEARCFFLGEYTARAGFSHSATNNLIQNFKKPMDRRGTSQWRWKEKAIADAAGALNASFGNAPLHDFTFVPIPPSKVKADPMYDDRMMRMLHMMRPGLDIRELVLQRTSRPAAHDVEDRPRPEDIAANYEIDENLCVPAPRNIIICDDMLTTGCQFMAMRSVLSARFPHAPIYGVFLARRAPQAIEFETLFLEE
jgi:hypothetical protein